MKAAEKRFWKPFRPASHETGEPADKAHGTRKRSGFAVPARMEEGLEQKRAAAVAERDARKAKVLSAGWVCGGVGSGPGCRLSESADSFWWWHPLSLGRPVSRVLGFSGFLSAPFSLVGRRPGY